MIYKRSDLFFKNYKNGFLMTKKKKKNQICFICFKKNEKDIF